jgi:hypothetical protein
MDGNFSAEHMRCRSKDQEALLSSRMAFMANPNTYKTHMRSVKESVQVSESIVCGSLLILA